MATTNHTTKIEGGKDDAEYCRIYEYRTRKRT